MPTANPLQPPLPSPTSRKIQWGNLHGSSIGLSLASLIQESNRPVIIIAPDTLTANRINYELEFFYSEKDKLYNFADWETLPYDYFSPHQDIVSNRIQTLYQLPTLASGAVITTIATVMHRLCPQEYLSGHTFLLKEKDKLDIAQTRRQLEKAGYRNVPQVTEHGEYAVRGSLIDLFPMGSDLPFRIDLFDDEIDSIRTFSPDTQRTIEKISSIELLPAKEFPLTDEAIELFRDKWRSLFSGNPLNSPIYQDISEGIATPGIEYYLPLFFNTNATFFDYLPENSLIITIEQTHAKSEEFWQEIQTRYGQRSGDITRPILAPKEMFIPVTDVFASIQTYDNIKIQHEELEEHLHHINFNTNVPMDLSIDHKSAKPLALLENYIQAIPGRILFCAETTGRREALLGLFNNIKLFPKLFSSWNEFYNSSETTGITVAPLEEGLVLEEPNLAIIAESQLFGKRIMQRRRRKETVQDPDALVKDLTELQIGSPIVHIDHGVGRYLGLQALNVGEQLTEFLHLEYAGGDKLYVPVSSLHLINRYTGSDPENAPLHKLGTDYWNRAKRKAAEQVRDVAAELLDVYAKREARAGFSYKIPSEYTSFAGSFMFEETPDQQRAIEQVLNDMTLEKTMDRLVCGDVGFGKTEVAMRAAFVAAQNAKQTVVLVPTTLLAQQHYQNFQDRFADWPIQVEVMSRFKSSKEHQKIISKIEEGKVDIIIGTHKLLQNSINYKDLGLLIIDEEHRFGVRQKEKIKSLRHNIDILTLTATPIPRTLNMAFAGIRDLSIIATPPSRRLSIKTFIHEYQKPIIQEAILREILRGGQVYFLHNDVAHMEGMVKELEKLVPEARVAFAHGQMRERDLEQVMADFYHRRFNVLVCSTIVESGIDVPSANTIIINRADKFGLAQLHQLRGRVGRSHHQAYAYLLIPNDKKVTGDAAKRLEAIAALEDLGVGFTLATHDLEIRGAGELLGEDQSGNMQAIGFSLYMELLSRAVDALKKGQTLDDLESAITNRTEIDLQIPALIPEKYLGDVHLRLQFYKRISSAKDSRELDEIQVEMIDRFGLLPEPAKNLFAITLLKQRAAALGILKIEANAKGGKIEFADKPNVEPIKIINLIQKESRQFKLEGPTRLRLTLAEHERKNRIEIVEKIIDKLV